MGKDKTPSLSARHWNGNQICAIDIETTGLDPFLHEIIQVAILPLDAALNPRADVMPYYVNIKPECPELYDPKVDALTGRDEYGARKHRISKNKLTDICLRGHDSETAKELLYQWISRLKLPLTKWGRPKIIFPLGHNYAHDRAFIVRWLGSENYEEFFGTIHHDTMVAAHYLNEQAAFHGNEVPYNKTTLTWVAKVHNVDTMGRHDALIDAKITAEVYKAMCRKGIF